MGILTAIILLAALVLSAITTAAVVQRNHDDNASIGWLIGGILLVEWGLVTLGLLLIGNAEQWTTPVAALFVIAGAVSLAAGTAAGCAYTKQRLRRRAGR